MEKQELEKLQADLEKSISKDEKPTADGDSKESLEKGLATHLMAAAKDFIAKASGAVTSDLPAEKDKRGELTTSGKDPAESPVKSGQGYKDSSKYEARKGDDEDEDDEDDKDEMPSFFKKKAKKKMKKSEDESEEEEEDSEVDATEFLEQMGGAVDHLGKSVRELEEGMAVFGELLSEIADPRRDNLNATMAKALAHLVTEVKDIKKSLAAHESVMKSISTMPGAPRVAAMHVAATETETAPSAPAARGMKLEKSMKDRLWRLTAERKISVDEYKHACATGDVSILDRVK